MTAMYISTLSAFAQRLATKNPLHTKETIIDLFFKKFLENDEFIFTDADRTDLYDPEIIYIGLDRDELEAQDGQFCRTLDGPLIRDQDIQQAKTFKKNAFILFNRSSKQVTKKERRLYMVTDKLHHKISDNFLLSRRCLISHFFYSISHQNFPTSDKKDAFLKIIHDANQAFHDIKKDESEKLENACKILILGIREWSKLENRGIAPQYHSMAQYILIHDAVRMRFIAKENLVPLEDSFDALKKEARQNTPRDMDSANKIKYVVRLLVERNIIQLEPELTQSFLARQIKIFMGNQKTEDNYRKLAVDEYGRLLTENKIKSKTYKTSGK